MKVHNRYLSNDIKEDLSRKMIFLYGPRQVGKTTLALSFLKKGIETHPAYFNWDYRADRKRILAEEFPPHEKILIFDEIHKYSRWRNFIKGLYDKQKSKRRFLITGSGNLKHYKRGGDSLQGRYYSYRLHPFSLRELNSRPTKGDLDTLLKLNGFPEPLLSGSQKILNKWRNERLSQLIKEDIRDLERIRELDIMEILMDSLPQRVGSPLSIKSLKEDLEISHETVERWICILESLFVCFRILPFGSEKIRAVKKEKKLYLYDWSSIDSSGIRFENLVACQLLKYCHFIEDTEGERMELRFLRDTDKREVDFVVLKNKLPVFAVECKSGTSISPHIAYFQKRTKIPQFYQVHLKQKNCETKGIRILPFETFCKELSMP
ncbi:MAG: ATP-binding protein [Bdellovibrionales bacterium]|nr:ATP-binding protein [Bdellovibrionales bacterium]